LGSLVLGTQGIFLYNINTARKNSRLRLRVKAAENRYSQNFVGYACLPQVGLAKEWRRFSKQKQPVGAMGWRTFRFRIKYNPESILRMVAQMAHGAFSSSLT